MPGKAALWLAFAIVFIGSIVEARNRLVFFPAMPERLPAIRYAALDSNQCLGELVLRKLPYLPGKASPTIDTPVHLTGLLRGVEFRPAAPSDAPPLMDCRLLLALDDFAAIVKDHGITIVRYRSVYRRGFGRKGQRHPAGVAIDIEEFVKDDGTTLSVLRDFHKSHIGSATCGEKAPAAPPGKPRELRELVCAVHQALVFNLILSPHYDYRHRNHLHLEVRRGTKWFLTQ